MKRKLTILTLDVPYKRAGNVITHHSVTFDVYEKEGVYVLMPLLDGPELAVANLPVELRFVMEQGKPVSLRGKIEGNLHVIEDAATKLKEEGLLLF